MNTSPDKKTKKTRGFSHLMDNNKFVMVLSLLIAFAIWVAVAMYKSPEESYTIYNVPITIDTENSIVSQRGYVNFWQSDEKIDVTVTGPRYMVTELTADDLLVSANLNSVDNAGVSELTLKVSLRENSQDITISAMSKTSVEVYFDAELEKQFDIQMDDNAVSEHIAEGYQFKGSELTVSTVTLKGPETEINKIVRVVADPQFSQDFMYATETVPVTLNLEGETAAETVSVNKYVEIVDGQEYFVKINISKTAELEPSVEFTGTKTGETSVSFNTNVILAKIDTEYDFDDAKLNILTVDYSSLTEGENTFTVRASDIDLPEGVTLTDSTFVFNVTITFTSGQQ